MRKYYLMKLTELKFGFETIEKYIF